MGDKKTEKEFKLIPLSVWILIIIAGLIPVILFGALLWFFAGNLKEVFNTLLILRKNSEISQDYVPQLKDIIYYLIYSYTIIISGIFSYALYRTSLKNNYISNEIKGLTEQSFKLNEKIVEMEERREQEKVRSSALAVYYDLKLCFQHMFNMIVEYSIQNSKVSMEREERDKYILYWKDIIRGFNYSGNWRNYLEAISTNNSQEPNIDIEELYKIYSIIELSRSSIDNNSDIHKCIELIPYEEVFQRNLTEMFRDIKSGVSLYDDKFTVCDKADTEEVDRELEYRRLKIYEKQRMFENIDRSNVLLNEKWEDILNKLFTLSRKQ